MSGDPNDFIDLTLKWTLKNISGKDVYVRDTNLFLDYKITVRNSHNDPVRLTERGQQASTASYFSRRKTTILLRPRQETAKELQISDFYDMTAKGVYTIVIQRDVPSEDGKSSETIRSNAVKVKIGN